MAWASHPPGTTRIWGSAGTRALSATRRRSSMSGAVLSGCLGAVIGSRGWKVIGDYLKQSEAQNTLKSGEQWAQKLNDQPIHIPKFSEVEPFPWSRRKRWETLGKFHGCFVALTYTASRVKEQKGDLSDINPFFVFCKGEAADSSRWGCAVEIPSCNLFETALLETCSTTLVRVISPDLPCWLLKTCIASLRLIYVDECYIQDAAIRRERGWNVRRVAQEVEKFPLCIRKAPPNWG